MKTEKKCETCMWAKIRPGTELPVLCRKSIREVKSKHCLRFSVHSLDDVCRKWESRETEDEK